VLSSPEEVESRLIRDATGFRTGKEFECLSDFIDIVDD
jgi:hypothetical protein